MSQGKIIAGLTVLVALYAAFTVFLLGRQSGKTPPAKADVQAQSPSATAAPPVDQPATQPAPDPTPPPAPEAQRTPETQLVAVEIGEAGPDLDACPSAGRPRGLNPNGDNFLAVKAAPNLQARRIDKLGPGDAFYICQSAQGGEWTGIVYSAGGGLGDGCGVASTVDRRQNYSGSCRSGWVFSKYVEVVAG